jgi:CxxC motif-containing protein (DUF1111 family)
MKKLPLLFAAGIAVISITHSGTGNAVIPGAPLSGVTARELELFRMGLEDFNEVETAEEGLGPAFNGRSCGECHSVPATGGIAAMSEIRAAYIDEDGKFQAFYGETLYNLFSTGKHTCQVQIPEEANVIARRVPIPVFGAGLVEAIPDAAILALEDPEDRNGDGIKGRAARVLDRATGQTRIGRFGWKAQQATLLAFSADAYRNEMGITNDLFREELYPGVDPARMKECDPRPDPEDRRDRLTGLRGIDNFENFMRLLAPIERAPETAEVAEGERLFRAIGCGQCHVPELSTGPSNNPLFDRRPVRLFSDLLLHDIGTGDGIEQADARGNEMRTPALWGLRYRRPLLHDGSAATAIHAVNKHTGEAEEVRRKFEGLTPEEKKALAAFLASL